MDWLSYLDNPTLSVFPFDYLRPAANKAVEAQHSAPFEADYITALAVFIVVVYRCTGDEDIILAVGLTAQETLIRVAITASDSFSTVRAAVAEQYANNTANHRSISDIAAAIKDAKASDDLPNLFRMSFEHAGGSQQLATSARGSVRDLAVFVGDGKINIYYNGLLFKQERIIMLAEQMQAATAAATADETVAVGSISLVTASQHQVLPDPTADLDWTGYRGAIQDIFSDNADRWPERPCVVETRGAATATSFTYRQIHYASNIVAHKLVAGGIVRGDVVMIYAHRGVDLVVAVMAVLKAGATFSVIDPAYPPARQKIYLSVARPRGLIGLAKAGVLADEVWEYVHDELDVVCTVPQLELKDDGTIMGGAASADASAPDVLDPLRSRAAERTGVVVGPDSNPTLSFTSGSEGVPKGVLGRHYSLAYYFPWMAQRFGLSSADKFTMLSGIAHDPIQRDMFTPLFLGAQLLVPTADDIGTPGQLAVWMATHGATVTHLTPAMGQLLSAQAVTPFPALHHAFFVGDILTKRDCLRLQSLAENVAIVNMYGTTETQRAVSYYEIPLAASAPAALKSMKDVMPAGSGMVNVQLLIVNRSDTAQTCGVGEVGEIYVRAAGLSEGYRGLPDLNAQKFVTNWFVGADSWADSDRLAQFRADGSWYGPRDRLYRTGDLGRYLPDGNVECCGRADDQVKIRGFRIELGEIDTFISQYSGVRQNVTMVRRDKNEEPVLVSYIVPSAEATARAAAATAAATASATADVVVSSIVQYQDLIKDLKAYLKTKLAAYAVPTLVVPMAKLPLNPNGKVDKPKLPFPDTAQLTAVAQLTATDTADLSPFEQKVVAVWREVIPTAPAIGRTDLFFDVGGHSILATRMIFALRSKLAVDIPLGLVFSHPTLEQFSREVERVVAGDQGDVVVDSTASAAAATAAATADYAADAKALAAQMLAPRYQTLHGLDLASRVNILVTGVTGFLGLFIVKELMEMVPSCHVYAHVRAKDTASGMARVVAASKTFGVWTDAWADRITPVIADLSAPQLGLDTASWTKLADTIDVIIHNGAFVHWVYPYERLRDANVIGSINLMNLAAEGRPKYYGFVLSTSALDTDHYVRISDEIVARGGPGVSENDDLAGSSVGLGNGYGQSKWAAEYIIREAGARGLRGSIIRAGYVTGFSATGASNTDDFLLRMLKGCCELGVYPDIDNHVNMVPVDHVARVTVATSLFPVGNEVAVCHVTAHPRIKFNEFVGLLNHYGYGLKQDDYPLWKMALEQYVVGSSTELALFPLLHFVLDDLPANTKAPELDDANTSASLDAYEAAVAPTRATPRGVSVETMGRYISYLVKIGFLPAPKEGSLPDVEVSEESLQLISAGSGGRGSAA